VDADRRAVLIGAGAAHQHEPPGAGVDAVELMIRAVLAAGDDAGARPALAGVQRILVAQGTWAQGTWRARDPGRSIARAIGATGARTVVVQIGIPQQSLINQALAAIAAGEIDVALVVGGEAKRRDDLARRSSLELPPADDPGTEPDEVQTPSNEIVAPAESAARFVVPVEQYAAIDNARRGRDHDSIAEHLADIDGLWARFDAVASANPDAPFAGSRTAAQLRSSDDGNRPLAFPYHKWHATQWSVDQASALLCCAEDRIAALGADPARAVAPLVALESSHSVPLSQRAELDRWPAMAVLGAAAAGHLGRPLTTVEHVELYSCFPAAVRVQQRELGLPPDGTPTITGGMAFAGGPFNNFVLQATVAMARRLRAEPGTLGLVTTVSGLLTKPGLAVWSSRRSPDRPLLGDLHEEARAATATRAAHTGERGTAIVATYTVRYDAGGPAQVVAIADTPDDDRVVVVIDDRAVAERATVEEFIGTRLRVDGPTATVTR
jgi:acetyl-CoA C-acetyltransferase